MTTADQLAIVGKTLSDGEKALVLADGGLVEDWIKTRRLLVVVKGAKSDTYALFIYVAQNIPLTSVEDLTINYVLPIDSDFKCEIDSSEAALYIKLSSNKYKLMFEMLPSYHTQNFVGEVFRLTESVFSEDKCFKWLDTHITEASLNRNRLGGIDDKFENLGVSAQTNSTTNNTNESNSILDKTAEMNAHSDATINRQDIAMGGMTPIAARESVVKYQMSTKEDQFTEIQHFRIYCATWNVNGQSPGNSVSEWLSQCDEPPDIYAIGFQELDLSKEAFLFTESLKEDEWREVVKHSLHPKGKYIRVKLVRLVGMMLVVYVKETHLQHVKDIQSEHVGTGIMGKLGNKGGVAVRFDFHNTSICFVNSHLAAHVSEVERRNQDYQEICNRMIFNNCSPAKAIKDHDMVYWVGDLNYRITDLDASTVKDIIASGQLKELFNYDQFKQQRHQRKVFNGYTEHDITFAPTYKFDPGTDNWDTSEKARAPAWTDRILWKGKHIEQKTYRSHFELKVSDHKPVSAIFDSGMKVVDQVKYRKIYEDVMKRLDKLENEFLPQVTVDTTEIVFDTIKFNEASTKNLIVANTGQVPVQFGFIKKLNDTSYCKPWLSAKPAKGFVMPGDKCDIDIEIYVNKKTAGDLNCGQDQMYDILVLHLHGGKDIFITVSGTYQRSCFGASIDALCNLTVPIAELSVGELLELEGTTNGKKDPNDKDSAESKADKKTASAKGEEKYPVPKELWFLCDLIAKLGIQQEQLFLQPGLSSEVRLIIGWLDTGLPADGPSNVSIHSAAETLLLFLESLRIPIVPYTMYTQCLESAPNYLLCKQIVSQLPTHHRHVFHYIAAFLREVMRHSKENGVDAKVLATLFGAIVLRDPPGTNLGHGIMARSSQQVLDMKKARFVYHFLINDPDDQSVVR